MRRVMGLVGVLLAGVIASSCDLLVETAPDLTGVWNGQIVNATGRYNFTLHLTNRQDIDGGYRFDAQMSVGGGTVTFEAASVAANGSLQLMAVVGLTSIAGNAVGEGDELTLTGDATATSLEGTARVVGPSSPGEIGTFTATK